MPYAEYRSDMGIYRALDRKVPPKRPTEFPGTDDRATAMWQLLLQCWDHDPSARPETSAVMTLVGSERHFDLLVV